MLLHIGLGWARLGPALAAEPHVVRILPRCGAADTYVPRAARYILRTSERYIGVNSLHPLGKLDKYEGASDKS